MTIKFKYIGEGNWIPNIPARHLTEAEVESIGLEVLRASSLYEEVKSKPKKEDVNERSDEAQEDSAGSGSHSRD